MQPGEKPFRPTALHRKVREVLQKQLSHPK